MKRNFLVTALVGLLFLPAWIEAGAAPGSRLISPSDAERVGLTRAWFTQVRLDPGRAKVEHIRLFQATDRLPDTLFVQTDRAIVHAIDAETGQTLWVRTVGSPNHPSMALGANDEVVGVANGTTLYLIDRADGRIVWMRRVTGIPADGLVLTNEFAFVPMLSGQVLAYPIKKRQFEEDDETPSPTAAPTEDRSRDDSEAEAEKRPTPEPAAQTSEGPLALEDNYDPPLTCVSLGRVTSQPIFVHEEFRNQYLAWSTTTGLFVGYINLTRQDDFPVKYQLRTTSPMVTQPTYLPPGIGQGNIDGLVFSTSAAGEIHAVAATRGTELWQYAVGQPINEPVIPIRERLYAVTELGTLFCLDSMTGEMHWSTEGVGQFVAAGKDTVYVTDRGGQLLVLNANTGARVDSLFTSDLPLKFRNVLTDRIYLATPSGLIQCLRETAQTEPLRHRRVAKADVEKTPQPGPKPKDTKDPFAVPGQEDEKNPPAAPAPGKEAEDPFAAPAPGNEAVDPFAAPAPGGENPSE